MTDAKRKKSRCLLEREEAKLVKMFICGFRFPQIASYFHIAETTARQYVERYGITADDILPIDEAIKIVKEEL